MAQHPRRQMENFIRVSSRSSLHTGVTRSFVRSFDSSKRISTNSSTKDFPFCVDYPLQPLAIKLPPRVINKNISSLIRAKVLLRKRGEQSWFIVGESRLIMRMDL